MNMSESGLKLRQIFLAEAQENLFVIEANLEGLDPRSPDYQQKFSNVNRSARTLKMGATMMQLGELSRAAQQLEDTLTILNDFKPDLNQDIYKLFLLGIEQLHQIVAFIDQGETIEPDWLVEHIDQVFEKLQQNLKDLAFKQSQIVMDEIIEIEITPQIEIESTIAALVDEPEVVGDMSPDVSISSKEDLEQEQRSQEPEPSPFNLEQTQDSVDRFDPKAQADTEPDRGFEPLAEVKFEGKSEDREITLETFLIDVEEGAFEPNDSSDLGKSKLDDQVFFEVVSYDSIDVEQISHYQEMFLDNEVEISEVFTYESSLENVFQDDMIPFEMHSTDLSLEPETENLVDRVAIAKPSFEDHLGDHSQEPTFNQIDSEPIEMDDAFWLGLDRMLDSSDSPKETWNALINADFEVGLTETNPFSSVEIHQDDLVVDNLSSSEIYQQRRSEQSPSTDLEYVSPVGASILAINPNLEPESSLEVDPIDLIDSTPTIASDLSSIYLTSNVRLPVSQLENLSRLANGLVISKSNLDVQLSRLKDLSRNLQQNIRSLDDSQDELHNAYSQNLDRLNQTLDLVEQDYQNQDLSDQLHENGIVMGSPLTQTPTKYRKRTKSISTNRPEPVLPLAQSVKDAIAQLEVITQGISLALLEAEQESANVGHEFSQLATSINYAKMQPFSELMSWLSKGIADLSIQYDRPVELKIRGGDILIERAIVDTLIAPIEQILHSVFAEGIEDGAAREALGKQAYGNIEIAASQTEISTLVTIRVDGKGFDLVDRSAIYAELRPIGAELWIDSKLGEETRFAIEIPRHFSSLQILLVEVDRMFLAAPCSAVRAVVPLSPDGISLKEGERIFVWEEQEIPVIRLSDRLKLNCHLNAKQTLDKPDSSTPSMLILAHEQNLIAISVDTCWGQQEAYLQDIAGDISLPDAFSGCLVLESGQPVVLLSPAEIFEQWIKADRSGMASLVYSPPAASISLSNFSNQNDNVVLIVDDSSQTRRNLVMAIEKAGFKTEQAKDGDDALMKIRSGIHVNAIVSDVEMPHMNGYEMLSRLKANQALSHLPVIFLATSNDQTHRDQAIELGAAAYFCEPYQEQDLIQILKQELESQAK
jgi:chemotaxis protein histidine kinase CheA/CheY-like chemotaxis protein